MSDKHHIDETSRAILAELQKDGRLSIQELSARVNLSPTPVARRLRAMEESGLITGYSVRLDEEKTGYPFTVFISVSLNRQIDNALQTFENAVKAFPEVVDCWLMTGNRDYLLRVATAGLREYETFLTGRFNKIPGVETIETSVPLRRVKGELERLP
ncbi:Lrp/AsnC family transcriptional regulator [Terasakiella sp. A23]|uniref:Lrp/AsnC family transcriptional regulator n=1 Tax=Terasakiella sp. FCG-A23 TaxID=3080561 RepID=UPI0029540C85|nr:Lrp/AsnC family transcriptional regulator [Terasakiella sp. A23]MDV7340487.1 Lrp/AsnC family transcriptional regulator [Terasakiella sp. A23]